MIIQQTDLSEDDYSGGKATARHVTTWEFLLSEVQAAVGGVTDYGGDCKFPSSVVFTCASGSCVKGRFNWDDANPAMNTPNHEVKRSDLLNASGAYMGIDSDAMAGRLVNAIKFYQKNSAAATPSPF